MTARKMRARGKGYGFGVFWRVGQSAGGHLLDFQEPQACPAHRSSQKVTRAA